MTPGSSKYEKGNTSPNASTPKRSEYTIGWVCALREELTAATSMLDNIHGKADTPSTDDNIYVLGSVGKHRVVIACLPMGKYGTTSAASVATQMLGSFPSIKLGLMVGIGGGIPSKDHDVRLGDVVVSRPEGEYPGVVQWDFGKSRQGGKFERTGTLNNPHRTLLSALSHLHMKHELSGSKISQYLEELETKWPNLESGYRRSDALTDVLFLSIYSHRNQRDWSAVLSAAVWGVIHALLAFLFAWPSFPKSREQSRDGDAETDEDEGCRFCDTTQVVRRKARPGGSMKVHYGLIASGNQVIKDATYRDKLNRDLGGQVLCVEMEAAGLMDTFPCIVIRGICDYADSHKNKKWQKHAAVVAAAFAKELLLEIPAKEVEMMVSMKTILGINTKLEELSKDVKKVQRDEKHKEILEWLTTVSYAHQQHHHFNRRCRGTCEWLLRSDEFQSFVNGAAQAKTMMCKGNPGVGKTVLTSIVIDHLQRFCHDKNEHPVVGRMGLAYVYCDFDHRSQQRPVDLLAGLIRQLIQDQPDLPKAVTELYKKHREISSSSRSHDDIIEFTQTLTAVIRGTYDRVFIAIDALDEGQASPSLLANIFKVLGETNSSLFATSRPDASSEFFFEKGVVLEVQADADDVKLYIDSRISELKVLSDSNRDVKDTVKTQLRTEIQDKVSKAVDGVFLLARFHLDSLFEQTTPSKIRNTLDTLPRGPDAYDEAYGKTVRRICSQQPKLQRLAKHTLQWLICARDPLQPQELRHALAVEVGSVHPPGEDDLESTSIIIDVCMGLVVVEENSGRIRLLHYTTMEYFQANMGCLLALENQTTFRDKTIFSVEECEAALIKTHQYITHACIAYLSCEHSIDEDRPFFDYSRTHWGEHARECLSGEDAASETRETVIDFLDSDRKVSVVMRDDHRWVRLEIPGIHFAAYTGLPGVMLALLERGHDVNARDDRAETPLCYALRQNFLSPAKRSTGALHWLKDNIEKFNNGSVAATLKKIERYAGWGREQREALQVARACGNDEAFNMLMLKGNEFARQGRANGCFATMSRIQSMVSMLLERGANPNHSNQDGQTPLFLAAEHGNKDIVSVLLNYGADVNHFDSNGRTPLFIAIKFKETAIVSLLLDKGAKVNVVDTARDTPLYLAAESRDAQIVELLLNRNAEPDNYGFTPLVMAASNGDAAVVKLLLKHGAAPNANNHGHHRLRNTWRSTGTERPLHYAAKKGSEAVVSLLLAEEQTVVNPLDHHNCTPFQMSLGRGNLNVSRLLLAAGGNLMGELNEAQQVPVLKMTKKAGKDCDTISFQCNDGAIMDIERAMIEQRSAVISSLLQLMDDESIDPLSPVVMPFRFDESLLRATLEWCTNFTDDKWHVEDHQWDELHNDLDDEMHSELEELSDFLDIWGSQRCDMWTNLKVVLKEQKRLRLAMTDDAPEGGG